MNKPDPIPFRLTIGVTGHRKLENIETLREKIKNVIDRILANFPPSVNTSVLLRILSPLAEGSDRLVVEEVLKYKDAELKVILPLCTEEYLESFQSHEAQKEFTALLNRATYQLELNKKPLKEEIPDQHLSEAKKQAYEDAGRYVVGHSEVLIAIWDELPSQGKGGTASIVQFAKSKGCPIFIINPNSTGETKFIEGQGFDKDIFKQINKFNSFSPDEKLWRKIADENKNLFLGKSKESEVYNLSETNKTIVENTILPYYIHSEIFSLKSQKWYRSTGLLVFWLSFFSVAIVAYGEIFFDHIPRYIFVMELIFLLIISLLIFVSHKRAAHRGYIENRFLTEHLRTDIILTLCGIKVYPPDFKRHTKNIYTQKGWMVLILEHILSKLPQIKTNQSIPLQVIKDYIREIWINSQIEYHKGRIKKIRVKNETLETVGELIFYLAILIAVIHVFFTIHLQILDNFLILSVLLLPALGATITAIKTHRDYKKILSESTIILNDLESLHYKFSKTLTQNQLKLLIEKTEKIMRRETEEWLEFLALKELEKAV